MKRMGCAGMVVVVLLVVIGYQQWRIHQLESKIASISTKVQASKVSKAAAQNKDLAKTLAQAQAYTHKAQEFLESKNFARAQEQLKKARAKLDSANSFSKGLYGNSAQFLDKAKVRTEKVFKEAWKDISTETKPEGGAGASKGNAAAPEKKQSND